MLRSAKSLDYPQNNPLRKVFMSYYMEDADNTGYLDQGLEISKLVEKEKKAAAGSEFDVLHDKVVAAKKTEALS